MVFRDALCLSGMLMSMSTVALANNLADNKNTDPYIFPHKTEIARAGKTARRPQSLPTVTQLAPLTITAKAPLLSLDQLPASTPLSATQPTSVIDRSYILNTQSPNAGYGNIIANSPSVVTRQPNGPGLGTNKNISIRGFKDGQFNLLLDGIPIGDDNDFTHHAANYFMPQDIGSVRVDRGPGEAKTVGYATFGGSVGIQSRQPDAKANTKIYGSYGSFNTRLVGGSIDSGNLARFGGLKSFIDFREIKSDGYLTHNTIIRKNLFFKAVKPLGQNTTVTAVAMYNKNTGRYAVRPGATSYPYVTVNNGKPPFKSGRPGQMQIFGRDYSLNDDKTSQDYFGYGHDLFRSDFDYLGIRSQIGPVLLEDKLYSYGFHHPGQGGDDPNGGNLNYGAGNGPAGSPGDGTFPAGAGATNGTVYSPTDVPGNNGIEAGYRHYGNLLRLSADIGPGEAQLGLWTDYEPYTRSTKAIDLNRSNAYNADSPLAAYDHLVHGQFLTLQPYLQYKLDVTQKLSVTGGLKYAYFRRHDNAIVQGGTGERQNYAQVYTKLLPSGSIHYQITDQWSAYFQGAEGYLAPNESLFEVADPGSRQQNVKPESTANYQLGTVWNGDRASVSLDVYAINFSNMAQQRTVGNMSYYTNVGGVHYRGVELEAGYYLGAGFSVDGNVTYNRARRSSDHLQLSLTPEYTGSAALLYNKGSWDAALSAKYIGVNYGDIAQDTNGKPIHIYRFSPTAITNFSLHYTISNQFAGLGLPGNVRLGFQIFNLADSGKLDNFRGYTSSNVPLFYSVPGRSFLGSIQITL